MADRAGPRPGRSRRRWPCRHRGCSPPCTGDLGRARLPGHGVARARRPATAVPSWTTCSIIVVSCEATSWDRARCVAPAEWRSTAPSLATVARTRRGGTNTPPVATVLTMSRTCCAVTASSWPMGVDADVRYLPGRGVALHQTGRLGREVEPGGTARSRAWRSEPPAGPRRAAGRSRWSRCSTTGPGSGWP